MNASIFVAILMVTLLSINNPITNLFAQDQQDQHQQQDDNNKKCQNTGDYLTSFNCGTVDDQTNIRHFTLVTEENIPVAISDEPEIRFPSWSFNGSVPGPTMRMTEGDNVSITVVNSPGNNLSHSLHLHSIHSGAQDGVLGPSGAIKPGESFTYNFIADPAGVYPYHCHVEPIENHLNRGLYGMMIIDPKEDREPVDHEMVMLMNGYDLNLAAEKEPTFAIPTSEQANLMIAGSEDVELGQERDNEIYTVNGRAFTYMKDPIELKTDDTVRVYLVNMLEFDLVNSLHLHGSMFNYIPSGTEESAPTFTDIVTLSQGDRGIMEFEFPFPGQYMFHAHQTEFSSLGWMGTFNVTDTET
jgi:manganese oxidase